MTRKIDRGKKDSALAIVKALAKWPAWVRDPHDYFNYIPTGFPLKLALRARRFLAKGGGK